MVEAQMKPGRLLQAGVAFVAFAFLVTMAVTGALPKQRQLVKFEAKGLLGIPPERVTTVALGVGSRSPVFERTPEGGWAYDGGAPLPAETARRLSMAVQFLHTSAPVRVLSAQERGAVPARDFGLDRPELSVALFEGRNPLLVARFGRRNPDGFLQYLTLDDRPELFLLSGFVGDEWAAVATATAKP